MARCVKATMLAFTLLLILAACGQMAASPAAEMSEAREPRSEAKEAEAPKAEAARESEAKSEPAPASESSRAESRTASIEAGKVDDNEQWDEYLQYRSAYSGPPVHDLDVSERYIISVTNAAGHPIPNALVRVTFDEITLFEGLTYANGQALFFPKIVKESSDAQVFSVRIEKDGLGQLVEFNRAEDSHWEIELEVEDRLIEKVPLDVLFLLDATGSMSDEINQIKSTLLSISHRISDLPSQPDLRFGMVTYRDRGDQFITRTYSFEQNIMEFVTSIQGVVADGGDDYPESLNEALHVAVNQVDWRLGEAIRLVFLIADAPPHLDYPEDYDYAEEMVRASQRGIKVFPIASSGLDAQGEYIFRQIALHTMGKFIFILYGGSTSHDVGEYTVENLDDLVVNFVEEELSHLQR